MDFAKCDPHTCDKLPKLKEAPAILTRDQRQIILGSALGDACVYKPETSRNAYVLMKHSIKQREYVEWKYNILKNLVVSPPKYMKSKPHPRTGKEYESISFKTRQIPCITEIHDLMGTREITQLWLDEITDPIALAVWYMDDGSCYRVPNKKSYVVSFHTGNRTFAELELLKSWMNNQFGLDHVGAYIPPNGRTCTVMRIWSDQTIRKLEDLVRPYVIPSMQYKLPPADRSQCRYQRPRV